jgi:hypothetical protein
MGKKLIQPHKTPPVFRQGYAVFIKLWDLTAKVSADVACGLFNTLDELLLSINGGHIENWFPSPYGGAIVVSDVEGALKTAKRIIQEMGIKGITVTIGIAFGRFERVHNVNRWNTAALAMNIAARMASSEELKGYVVVQPKVKSDAVSAKKTFKSVFGPQQEAKVKRTVFLYHLINQPDYLQKISTPMQLRTIRTRTKPADIVLFDIEKYSEKSQEQQTRMVDKLSKCVEIALTNTGLAPNYFGPAGDGGYLAFMANLDGNIHTAWSFAGHLRSQAAYENIPIRIGIANGPILSSNHRPIVGGVVLQADLVSSESPTGEIAVSEVFWENLATQLKPGWEIRSKTDAGSILVLKKSSEKSDNPSSEPSPTKISNQSVLESQIPEASKFEIEMYWGYRPAAHDDLRETILSCRSKLFIAGLGVTTIANVLNDPHVIGTLADNIAKYPDFERTIITFTREDDPRLNEQGGKELREKIRIGRKALRRFYGALLQRVPSHIVRPLIDFRSYAYDTIPRHFILQADEVIYVGSYLSHQQGSYSYLLKIRNRADGLFALFEEEVKYIRDHTVPQNIEEDG